jgi:hypothetical protein
MQIKKGLSLIINFETAPVPFLAERQGFEPWVPLGTRHFECRTIDHSDISPRFI